MDEKLEYRSINFFSQTINAPYFHENSVVNDPEAVKLIDVNFIGRLANYKYFDMD